MILSILGLLIVPILLSEPLRFQLYPSFSRLLTGSLYASICFLGIIAIFYPRSCENTLLLQNITMKDGANGLGNSEDIEFLGHHPTCKYFEGNRIRISKRWLCAACSGLLIGALVALIGTIIYFFVDVLFLPVNIGACLIGCITLLLGLVQFTLKGFVKLAANLLFVVGSFTLLVAADALTSNLLINLYVLGLIIFLLFTRILISGWNNKRICGKCQSCLLRSSPRS